MSKPIDAFKLFDKLWEGIDEHYQLIPSDEEVNGHLDDLNRLASEIEAIVEVGERAETNG